MLIRKKDFVAQSWDAQNGQGQGEAGGQGWDPGAWQQDGTPAGTWPQQGTPAGSRPQADTNSTPAPQGPDTTGARSSQPTG